MESKLLIFLSSSEIHTLLPFLDQLVLPAMEDLHWIVLVIKLFVCLLSLLTDKASLTNLEQDSMSSVDNNHSILKHSLTMLHLIVIEQHTLIYHNVAIILSSNLIHWQVISLGLITCGTVHAQIVK